jgi:hypothetical protein
MLCVVLYPSMQQCGRLVGTLVLTICRDMPVPYGDPGHPVEGAQAHRPWSQQVIYGQYQPTRNVLAV